MIKQQPVLQPHQAPATEPISLAEVKTYLRIEGESENGLLNSMIVAARITAERYMRASVISQKWKLLYNHTVPYSVALKYGPVTAVDSVTLVSEQGDTSTFLSSAYYLDAGNRNLVFRQPPASHRVEIVYTAGLAAAAENVPATIKQGMLAHIGCMYRRDELSGDKEYQRFYDIYRNLEI